eukprot:COSAG06_NODE_688_length_13072_cov_15.012719_8_plen_588_part_00
MEGRRREVALATLESLLKNEAERLAASKEGKTQEPTEAEKEVAEAQKKKGAAVLEAASDEAKAAANKTKEGTAGYGNLPASIQGWFKVNLDKGEDGIAEIAKGVVNSPHNKECKGKPAEFKAEVIKVLLASDFPALVRAQFPGSAAGKGVPPAAEKLYKELFDEIEMLPITSIGVDPDNILFTNGMALLHERAVGEMKEAMEKTKESRKLFNIAGIPLPGATITAKSKDLLQYVDGDKLTKVTTFAKDTVRKTLKNKHESFSGRKLKELDDSIKAAKGYLKQISSERAEAKRLVWGVLRPWFKTLGAGLLCEIIHNCSTTVWWTNLMLMPMIDVSGSPATVVATARTSGLILGAWWAIGWPIEQLGGTLIENAKAYFTMDLRNTVMKSILSQDRVYFDTNQTGALQERLNRDTGLVAEAIIQRPRQLATQLTKTLFRMATMYYLSPTLCMYSAIPVPLAMINMYVSVKRMKRIGKKIHKVHEVSAAGTIDILKEMTTVRQFVMEEKEMETYSVTQLCRRILERRLDTTRRLSGGLIGVGLVGLHILVAYLGIHEALAGNIDTNTVMMFNVYNCEDDWFCMRLGLSPG